MSVLHIIASVDPMTGGPIEGVLQQSAHRPVDEFEIHVASLDDPSAPFVKSCTLKVFAFGSPGGRPKNWRRLIPWVHYGYAPGLLPWLRANIGNYDVVIVNGLWNYATFAARQALVGSQTPYVVFTHGMLDPWFKRTYPLKSILKQVFWLFCEGPLLRHARAVLFTADEERELARGAFWPYHVEERVVGYGTGDVPPSTPLQRDAFMAAVPGLAARRYLLFLSRIHPKKGCDLLVEAFARIAASEPDVDLVIAGPDYLGWRKTLEERARALGIAERIHWPGMLTGDAKWGAFRGAEAFVLPSHQENFGIVVAEAMAAGKPVLITNKINIWREVKAAGAGLVDDDTPDGIERLLANYATLDQEERDRMGAAARRVFIEKFEIRNTVAALNQVLAEVAGRMPPDHLTKN